MKAKRVNYTEPVEESSAGVLRDAPAPLNRVETPPMIRTQIYLSQREYDFLQTEARRRAAPMAAVIRNFIDEKMAVPEDAWMNNPMLAPTVPDPSWKSPEDGGINHDHYLYGSPKKWIKVKGKYVEAPPLPDDYFENRASADAYDKRLRKLDESK